MAAPVGGYINIYFLDGADQDGYTVSKLGAENKVGSITTVASPSDKKIGSDANGNDPLTVTINSSNEEIVYLKCGIRTAEGYKAEGNVTISFGDGTDLSKQDATKYAGLKTNICWRVAETLQELYESGLTGANIHEDLTKCASVELKGVKDTVNTIFYIMVLAVSQEEPTVDNSVKIVTTATIAATGE